MIKDFVFNKINSDKDLIGNRLKREREEKRISLEEAAKEIKMNKKYLEAIEAGEFEKLPEGMYGKNFISEYAVFLGINPKKIIELYEAEFENETGRDYKKLFVKRISRAHHFLTVPKIIKNILIILAVLVCIAYLGYYINNIITPPEIVFYGFEEDGILEDNFIVVEGKTDPEAELLINEQTILLDNDGNFEIKINLKTGLNTIVVSVKKKYSKEKIIKRNIIVK